MDTHYIDLEDICVSSLLTGEKLRPDGSSYVPWFGRLKEMLMGENGCLQTHIMILETLYDELTHAWESWQSQSDLIDAVLASLPPSYANVVKEYVLGGNTLY